jgi:hypothetical protein
MVFSLKELFRFTNTGTRSENLDRIILSEKSVFIVDGYDCSEHDLDLAVQGMLLDSKCDKSCVLNGPNLKLCISGLHIIEGVSYIYHHGDCRIYIEGIGLATDDHSLAWEKVSQKYDSRKDISSFVRQHPCRDILTRYLATNAKITPAIELNNFSGRILLCTDGFWKVFSEEEMESLLYNPDVLHADRYSDNASCILIEI